MNRKRLTLLVSSICAVALLVITIVPAVASPPEPPRAQFAAVLERLTGEGVINSEQAEIIMERTGAIFGKMEEMGQSYRQRVKELAVARSRPILLRVSQALGMLETWYHDMALTSSHGVDPMLTVLKEGGAFHTRSQLPRYMERLRATGRAHHADRLAELHPDEV